MKIIIPALEVDPEQSPNMAGEYLRGYFFDQSRGYGCYSTFDMNEGVENLGEATVDDEPTLKWSQHKRGEFFMRWLWDGDGVLQFRLPDGSWLSNSDCKNDNRWEYSEQEPSW